MVKKERSDGAAGRGWQLGKLGLSLTGSYLGYQIQNLFLTGEGKAARNITLRRQAARRLREELQSMKGPVMKFGQILSMQSTAFPEEAIEELSHLQMRAPGMHPSLARAQFKASCGKYPEEVFQKFEPEPLAAASLGQVHEAVTKRGERVAVKIQYPAIRAAIENDFKLMRSATLPARLSGHLPANILEEMQRGFMEETDYLNEGRNLDFFREKMSRFSYLNIPKVFWELTTDRVLTMSFIEGVNLRGYLSRQPAPEMKNLTGNRLYELFVFQMQTLRAVHADPHPGNYLVGENGRIGLVDFGCVKRISPDIPELTRCFMDREWEKGEEQLLRMLRMIWGSRVSLDDVKARRTFLSFTKFVDIVFPRGESRDAAVDFGGDKVLSGAGNNFRMALENKLTNPEFLFVSRAELGLYNLLHELGAKVDTKAVWRRSRKAD